MGSVISCSELIINQECCTSAFSPLLPHGKSPSKNKEVISAEDPLSLPDSSCLPATANKPSELKSLWEPSTTKTQSSESEEVSPAIHNTQLSQLLTTITQSLLLNPTLTWTMLISPPSPLPTKNTQLAPLLKSPDGERPTVTSTKSQVATTPLMSQDDCKAIWGNLRITDRMQCVG